MLPLLFLLACGPASPPGPPSAAAVETVAPPQSPSALTLSEALRRARTRSPLRRAADERVESATIARRRIHRAPNPFFELRAENWGPGGSARDTFAVVTQTLELGGKYAGRRREAAAGEDLAKASAATTDWELAADVIDRYLSALDARGTLDVLTEHQRSLDELVRILEARVTEGTAAEADWRRLEIERTRVQVAVARAGIALERELALLSSLVGEPVHASQLVMPDVPTTLPPITVDISHVSRRPDVRAARAEADRLQAVTALERSAGVPDLSVSAGYKGTGGLRTGVAAVGLDIPLFQRNGAAIARATGEAQAAEHHAGYITERALADATAEWNAARSLVHEASRLDDALLMPAEVVRTAARTAFLEGGGDILRLVDAERGYAEAAADALHLRLDALRALLQARLSIGEEPLP